MRVDATNRSERRPALRALLLLAVTLTGLAGCGQRPPARHLLMICVDTVRYDSFMRTTLPDALDPWLQQAQIWDNAVATGPWTMPSVASTLTGLYPVEHGAGRFERELANLDTDPPSPLGTEARTLAEILSGSGFRTAAFVSHPFFLTELGLDQGFEIVRAAKGWRRNHDNFQTWRQRTRPGRRLFGYLHFMEAHDRHTRGGDRLDSWLDELDPEIRQDVRDRASEQACRDEEGRRCLQHQVYNSAVLELRRGIATILDSLQANGLLEDTVVLVYSDHGEEFWEHRQEQIQAAEDPRGQYGFGHGQSMYEELLHVPLLAWIPGVTGGRHEKPVSLVDVLPSVLAWLGIEEPGLAGAGRVLPSSRWASWRQPADRLLYASGIAYGPEKIATRSGPLKSVITPSSDRAVHFDLAEDPDERAPLENRNDLLMLSDTRVGDYLEMAASGPVASSSFSEEQIRALKAIGYLQGVEDQPAAEPVDGAVVESTPSEPAANPAPTEDPQ